MLAYNLFVGICKILHNTDESIGLTNLKFGVQPTYRNSGILTGEKTRFSIIPLASPHKQTRGQGLVYLYKPTMETKNVFKQGVPLDRSRKTRSIHSSS